MQISLYYYRIAPVSFWGNFSYGAPLALSPEPKIQHFHLISSFSQIWSMIIFLDYELLTYT